MKNAKPVSKRLAHVRTHEWERTFESDYAVEFKCKLCHTNRVFKGCEPEYVLEQLRADDCKAVTTVQKNR